MQILKKGNKEKETYKKRKEKKLNMQGKDNMVLSYFIINIHMQLKRKEAGYNSSYFHKPIHIHIHIHAAKGKGSKRWQALFIGVFVISTHAGEGD